MCWTGRVRGKLKLSEPIIELILKAADELNRYLDKAQTCSLSELPRCDSNLLSSMAAAARLATEDAAADVFDAAWSGCGRSGGRGRSCGGGGRR